MSQALQSKNFEEAAAEDDAGQSQIGHGFRPWSCRRSDKCRAVDVDRDVSHGPGMTYFPWSFQKVGGAATSPAESAGRRERKLLC